MLEAGRPPPRARPARARLTEVIAAVRSAMLGQVGDDFDRVHTVDRALKVNRSTTSSRAPLRPHLIDAVERGITESGEAGEHQAGIGSLIVDVHRVS